MLSSTIYLIAGILFATGGVATMSSTDWHERSPFRTWLSWMLYLPAYYLLYFSLDSFGVAGGYALWVAGTAVLITLIAAKKWHESFTKPQLIFFGITLFGLVGFGLGIFLF